MPTEPVVPASENPHDWDALLATADAAIAALADQVEHMLTSGRWPAPERTACREATPTELPHAA